VTTKSRTGSAQLGIDGVTLGTKFVHKIPDRAHVYVILLGVVTLSLSFR